MLKMIIHKFSFALLMFVFLLSGKVKSENNYLSNDSLVSQLDSIISYGKTFLGKPYRYEVSKGRHLDCSGFLSYIFSRYGVKLPTAAPAISSYVDKVDIETIEKGGLLFFKGRNSKSNSIGHVAMVISREGGKTVMMHSCSRGIIIETYEDNKYYTDRFLFAGVVRQSVDPIVKEKVVVRLKDTVEKNLLSNNDKKGNLRVMGVGDIMLGTNYPSKKYLPPNDGKDLLNPVKDLLISADVAFGNLEGVILSGEGSVKSCSDPSVCYAFKMPDHYVKYFKEAGFDLLSLANNHSGDFGETGKKNTQKLLSSEKIVYAGHLNCEKAILETKGYKVGFAAFAPNSGTVSINDHKNAEKIVKALDAICDVVIVSFHGGAEGSSRNHVTRSTEMFLGENRGNPYKFARVVIDAGADIVFGHGPHVPRAVDLYKNRFIAYSLGNFATYGRFNLKGNSGYAPLVDIIVNEKGEFISGEIHSFLQEGEGGPKKDETKKAAKEIRSLSKSDFPDSLLEISEEGIINKK